MELERRNSMGTYNSKHLRFGKKALLFVSFVSVLGVILVGAFYKDFGITGNVIDSLNETSTLAIDASLSVPELILNGEYEEVILSVGKDSFIYLDNKKTNIYIVKKVINLEGKETIGLIDEINKKYEFNLYISLKEITNKAFYDISGENKNYFDVLNGAEIEGKNIIVESLTGQAGSISTE